MRSFLKPFFYSVKLFSESPRRFKDEFLQDITKDYFIDKSKFKFKFIWCAGLPKSGTTLIENIFDELPYVRINSSPIRFYDSDSKNKKNDHDLTKNMIRFVDYKKLSFLKTHTPYSKDLDDLIISNKTKIIVVIRDLRSMLISRYFHILNDNSHWFHKQIMDLNYKEGFIASIEATLKGQSIKVNALEYYLDWIVSWKKQTNFNILLLNFENYYNNPIKYISSILNFCEIDRSAKVIENNLNNKRKSKSSDLKHSLNVYGKNRSTFNKNKINYYEFLKKYDLNDYFLKKIDSNYLSLACYDKSYEC